MPRRLRLFVLPALTLAAVLAGTSVGMSGQAAGKMTEWRTYGGDLASRRYAPLDQINRDNFKNLKVAWIWKSPDFEIVQSIEKPINPDTFPEEISRHLMAGPTDRAILP